METTRMDIADLARRWETYEPEAVLRAALQLWRGRIAIGTSFQSEGMVLLDMAHRIDPGIRVFTLDTGRLPQETHDFIDIVRARYGLDVDVVSPDPDRLRRFVTASGANAFYQSVELRQECCAIRKLEPLRRALQGLSAWIAGLRRDQTHERRSVRKVQVDTTDPARVKVCPLAHWTHEQVRNYLMLHDVPEHPLYRQGYTSIGCAPCTRPTLAGESPRAGRWWWEDGSLRECGLHASPRSNEQFTPREAKP